MPTAGVLNRHEKMLEARETGALSGVSKTIPSEKYVGTDIKNTTEARQAIDAHLAFIAKTSGAVEPKIPLANAIAFYKDEKNKPQESDLLALIRLAKNDQADKKERENALELVKKSYSTKSIGTKSTHKSAFSALVNFLIQEVNGNEAEARTAATEVASYLNSDSLDNEFFRSLDNAGGSQKQIRALINSSKYLTYTRALVEESTKTLEGANKRSEHLSKSTAEFRRYLAEKAIADRYEIKDVIQLSPNKTLKPVRITVAEAARLRGISECDAQAAGLKTQNLTFKEVLTKLIAGGNDTERAQAIAEYMKMSAVLEMRFGEADSAAKTPGATVATVATEQRKAIEAAEQLQALQEVAQSTRLLGNNIKTLFEDSLARYTPRLLETEIPGYFNTLTRPELFAYLQEKKIELQNAGITAANTITNEVDLMTQAQSATEQFESRKATIADSLVDGFFVGMRVTSPQDLADAKAFVNTREKLEDLSTSNIVQTLNDEKQTIVDAITRSLTYDATGNLDLTNADNAFFAQHYLGATGNPLTLPAYSQQAPGNAATAITRDNIQAYLSNDAVFVQRATALANVDINSQPNKLDSKLREKISEYNVLRQLTLELQPGAPNTAKQTVTATAKSYLGDKLLRESILKTEALDPSKLDDILTGLENNQTYGSMVATWRKQLKNYQDSPNTAATALKEIFDATTNANGLNKSAFEAVKLISESLVLNSDSIIQEAKDNKKDIGAAVGSLYENIISSSDTTHAGLALIKRIIARDEVQSRSRPIEQKLLGQQDMGYYQYAMSADKGFSEDGYDKDTRIIALGKLIQEISRETNPATKDEAIKYITATLSDSVGGNLKAKYEGALFAAANAQVGGAANAAGLDLHGQFLQTQRQEAAFGLANAEYGRKNSEATGNFLHRVLHRSLSEGSEARKMLTATADSISNLFTEGGSEAIKKLTTSTDEGLKQLREAFVPKDNYATVTYAKNRSKGITEQIKEMFFKAMMVLAQRLAGNSPASGN